MAEPQRRKRAFTLVELLVVIGIIAMLIGILLPSLKGARDSARRAKIQAQLNAIKQALQMFHNDMEDYPDSSKKLDPTEDNSLTAPPGVTPNDTMLYGAQALSRALVGKDLKGYVDRKRARDFDRSKNPTWYYDNPEAGYESELPRQMTYISEFTDFIRTDKITEGQRPANNRIQDGINTQYVITDAFDRPILYYKANPRKVKGKLLCWGDPMSDPLSGCPPYYYDHYDNDVFTGNTSGSETGWRFGMDDHAIKYLGDPEQPDDPDSMTPGYPMSFAKYIHNHDIGLVPDAEPDAAHSTVMPHNPDSYLLISTGVDGIYGTPDDINNFQER